MRFNISWRSSRAADHRGYEPGWPITGARRQGDPNLWAETAAGVRAESFSPSMEQLSTEEPASTESRSADGAGLLRERLLAVLADEELSLIPPSAGDMTREQWDALPEQERERYRRAQLGRVDPRFVPHSTAHAGSRSARVYR